MLLMLGVKIYYYYFLLLLVIIYNFMHVYKVLILVDYMHIGL